MFGASDGSLPAEVFQEAAGRIELNSRTAGPVQETAWRSSCAAGGARPPESWAITAANRRGLRRLRQCDLTARQTRHPDVGCQTEEPILHSLPVFRGRQ